MPQLNRAVLGFLVMIAGACLPDRAFGPTLAPPPASPGVTVRLHSSTPTVRTPDDVILIPVLPLSASALRGAVTRCPAVFVGSTRHAADFLRAPPPRPHLDPSPQN